MAPRASPTVRASTTRAAMSVKIVPPMATTTDSSRTAP